MSEAPAGWYPQPDGTQRYWDGSAWTEHISGTPNTAADAGSAAQTTSDAVTEPDVFEDTATVEAKEVPVAELVAAEYAPEAPAAAMPGPAAPIGAPAVMASGQYSGVAADAYSPSDAAPRKRKVWPIVVGVFVAVAAIIILAIVVIAFILSRAVSGPNEAVMDYDRAWQQVDCELLQNTITQAFQERQGFDDCATFESVAQPFADAVDTYTVTVTNTEIDGSTAYVYTTENWLDTDGMESEYEYRYTLVTEDGVWLIETAEELSAG